MANSQLFRTITFFIAVFLITPLFGIDGQEARGEDVPSKSSDLFETEKVWTMHLKFTPGQWEAIEPKGGLNLFDGSLFGVGMFLTSAAMRDGDGDKSESLSAEEFHGLAERWFAAWDADRDGVLDAKQLKEGVQRTLASPADGPEAETPHTEILAGKGKRNGVATVFGIEFDYVHADLEFEDKTFPDVAVRYKGNGSYIASRNSLKRSFKIDLNKFVKGQKLAGETTINLHAKSVDGGLVNEVMASAVYRGEGVPAPRTTYARVYVTVPGKHERRYLGLYAVVEDIDKHFLADRDMGKGGALLKPATSDLFAYLGEDWKAYERLYDPKTDVSKKQQRRFIEFCRLVTNATDQEFAARLGDYLDIDEFARYLAVSVWIADLDSFLSLLPNVFLYLHPETNRLQFIAWDKDNTFGKWGGGTRADREELSIREPWEGRKRFLERVFKVEAFRERYLAQLAELNDGSCRPERLRERVTAITTATRPAAKEESPQTLTQLNAVAEGKPLPKSFFGLGPETPTLLAFAEARSRSVADQLAGKSEGRLIRKANPRRQPEKKESQSGGIASDRLLKALDADKDGKLNREEFEGGFAKWFQSWDTTKAGILAEDEVRKGLNKAMPLSIFDVFRRDGEKPAGEKGSGGR